ncbi:MAG: response regulator [Proteobacteria bacterium]|nr:response regulator [Pseudomonadota bacterium]
MSWPEAKASARIMIVEDEHVVALDLSERLEAMGYQVVALAKSGPEAIGLAEMARPDLVLMDIVLREEMDGIEAARVLVSRFDLPIIFITAHGDADHLRRAMTAAPLGYVLKPFQDRELRIAVEMALYAARLEAERRQAERSLRDSRKTAMVLLNASPELALLFDPEGNVLMANELAARRLGAEVPDLLGRGLRKFLPPGIVESRLEKLRQVIDGQEPIEFIDKRGGRIFEHKLHPIFDGSGRIFRVASFSRDVTDRKQAEAEKEKVQALLRQSQKMEAVGTLAAGIAHDFNNILWAITGFAEITLDELPDGGWLHDNVSQILRGCHRAKDLVEQILAFSRQGQEDLGPLALVPLVKESLKMLRASLPTTIAIHQELLDDSDYVSANPTQIHQVLLNLLSNAAHAMRERGGVITVRLAAIAPEEESPDRTRILEPVPYLKLSVSDTGHGIDPSIIERVFDPFFTTKAPGEGTGLGLAAVHGIVKSHEGEVFVRSRPGRGTTFDIYLPRIDETRLEEVAAHPGLEPGSERLLLVDDETTLVGMVTELCSRLGYRVSGFSDSLRAIQAFREAPENFDLVLVDLTMPGLTGLELAREIKSRRPDIPIILCTGYSDTVSMDQISSSGIDILLTKPMSNQELSRALRRALAGSPPLTEDRALVSPDPPASRE